MNSHEKFILALNAKKKMLLSYEDSMTKDLIKRKCIPLDYCEYKKDGTKEEAFCFRFWDCDEGKALDEGIKDVQIKDLEILNEDYELKEYQEKGFCNVRCLIALLALFIIVILIVALVKFI